MARKSNETLLRERLAKVSDCPFDIFEFLTPTDELFDLIKNAEDGDAASISELANRLEKIYVKEKKSSDALVYLCKKGLALGLVDVALAIISYSLAVSECFSLALEALALVNEKAPSEVSITLRGTEEELRAMKLVADISGDTDIDVLDYDATLLPIEVFLAEHIYLFSHKLRLGKCSKDSGRDMLTRAELGAIIGLPGFSGGEYECSDEEISDIPEFFTRLYAIQERHTDSDWRDFWLCIIYEGAEHYLDGRYGAIATYVIARALERSSVKNKNAHALAWIHYLLFSDNAVLDEANRDRLEKKYADLKDSCMFDGIMPRLECEEELSALMREAVYTREKQAKAESVYLDSLGSIIRHQNKRFLMKCELVGHSKRGHKHTWEFKMSMPKEYIDKKMPTFQHFKVERANPFITRGGVTLERDKMASQIICRSEIKFGEVAHPFLIDIILDVNYISSVKCTLGELKIKSVNEDDKYVTYGCQLLLS